MFTVNKIWYRDGAVNAGTKSFCGENVLSDREVHRDAGADPERGFGDLSPLNFLEVKIIKNV